MMEQELDKALKAIEKSAKNALFVLGKYAGNDLSHTGLTEDPLAQVGGIVIALKAAQADVQAGAKYAGLTEEEVAALQANEREAELIALQQLVQANLASYQAVVLAEAVAIDEASDEPAADPVLTQVADRLPE